MGCDHGYLDGVCEYCKDEREQDAVAFLKLIATSLDRIADQLEAIAHNTREQ